MKLKPLVFAALLASALTGAWAENLSETVAPVPDGQGGWSAPIDAVHLQAGDFTDTFSLGSFQHVVVADGNLSSINLGAPFNIDFVSATLSNGLATAHYSLLAEDDEGFEEGDLAPTPFAAGLPLTLTVHGIAALPSTQRSAAASYSGNVNFALAPVPEAGTLAMLVAGLAMLGWLTRRRV